MSGRPSQGESDAPRSGGLVAALLEAVHTRLELIAVELEYHLRGMVTVLVFSCAVVVCLLLATAFGLTAVVVALWEAHRVLALLGASLAFVLLAAACGATVARLVRRHAGMIDGTLAQLRADRDRARGGR